MLTTTTTTTSSFTNTIIQSTSLPTITINDKMKWIQQLQQGQFFTNSTTNTNTNIVDDDVYQKINTIEINNTISHKNNCFLQSNGGYLVNEQQPIHVLQWHGDGGQYWSEFITLIPNNTNIILLNKMNVYTTDDNSNTTNTIHTVQELAIRLNMNYAYVITSIELNSTTTTTTTGIQYTGEAILSKCYIYDPIINRVFDTVQSMNKQQKIISNVALFVLTGSSIDNTNKYNGNYNNNRSNLTTKTNHIVVGIVHRLPKKITIRNIMWDYQFGYIPTQYQLRGIAQYNQLGSIIGGNIHHYTNNNQCEETFGLNNVDSIIKFHTYPANCNNHRRGHVRYSTICSNFKVSKEDNPLLPCYYYYDNKSNKTNIDTNGKKKILQISNHSIISIKLH